MTPTVIYLLHANFLVSRNRCFLGNTGNVYNLLRAYHGLSLSLQHLNEIGSVIASLEIRKLR